MSRQQHHHHQSSHKGEGSRPEGRRVQSAVCSKDVKAKPRIQVEVRTTEAHKRLACAKEYMRAVLNERGLAQTLILTVPSLSSSPPSGT